MRRFLLPLLLAAAPLVATAADNNFTVPLPFAEGTPFTITQGYDKSREAVPVDRRWIVGFKLPKKTDIVALHQGTVVEAGPVSDGTARLVVKHPDGHFTYHIGLPANGLAVQKEQAVKTGDKLASASGQVYFALVTRFPDGVYVSEPVTFYNGEPPERIEPRTGVTGVVRNKVATAAPAAAAPKVAPTAPAPASVPVATALRPKAEPADDPHPWFLPIGFAVTILVAVWGAWVTRKPQRATAKRPGNGRQQDQLLRQCGGDRGQMQRLIAYEQRRQPGLTPEQAARSALENWGRERVL